MSGKKEQIVEAGKNTRFKPGEVTNPNGRPKGIPNAATRYRRFLELSQAGKNPVTGDAETFTVAELMDLQQIKRALDGDLAAYREILDRLEGKAKQPTEMKLEIDGVEGTTVTPEMIAQIDRLLSGEQTTDDEGATLPGKRKGQR